jgi:hypothetical protein
VTEDDFVLKGVAVVLVHRHLHHKPIGNLPCPQGKREEPHEVERESLFCRLTSSMMMVVLFQIVVTSSHY